MEFILFLIIVSIIYSVVENYSKNNNTSMPTNSHKPKHTFDNKEVNFDNNKEFEKKKETHIINNYYTQNNTYVQQNNYYKKSKSKDENKDHSEKKWKELGYRIKNGETYSYKYYGKEIFTQEQVEKIGSYQIRYSKTGLAKKLLNDTGSKSHTKDILVENYGLSETKAKKLLNNL